MILLNSSLNSFIQLLGAIVIFLFILVITYFTTRWIGGFQKNQMTGKSIAILDTLRLNGNKYISVVKTGEVYLIIAVTKDNVTTLAKLSEEEMGEFASLLNTDQTQSQNVMPENFQEILEKIKTGRRKRLSKDGLMENQD
jgi:flagellar protein FliO/FliZ